MFVNVPSESVSQPSEMVGDRETESGAIRASASCAVSVRGSEKTKPLTAGEALKIWTEPIVVTKSLPNFESLRYRMVPDGGVSWPRKPIGPTPFESAIWAPTRARLRFAAVRAWLYWSAYPLLL